MLCFYSVGIFPEQNMADHLSCLSFADFYFLIIPYRQAKSTLWNLTLPANKMRQYLAVFQLVFYCRFW